MSSPMNPPMSCHMPVYRVPWDTASLRTLAVLPPGPERLALRPVTWPPQSVAAAGVARSHLLCSAPTTRIISAPGFLLSDAPVQSKRARPGAAVYEAKLSSPHRRPQDRLITRTPSLSCSSRAVMFLRLSHAASGQQPAADPVPSCPQRCLSSKHRFNGCLVSWIAYSMSTCLLVAD